MTDDVLRSELTDKLFRQATEWGSAKWSQQFVTSMWNILRAFKPFDSPLEVGFFVWWCVYSERLGFDDVLTIQRQVNITTSTKTYRLDFAVYPMDWPELGAAADHHGLTPMLIGVELDGYDFHERTKEQVMQRDRRDRDLSAAGWRILHYSGSEFTRDPEAVIEEVCSSAVRASLDLRTQLMKLDGRTPANQK